MADYQRVKAKARAWLDQLDVDTVQLMKVGIKGKKKLAEILDAYLSFLHHAGDSAERQKILARVEGLVQQTRRPDYHDMLSCSDTEFVQNSMSYLRVLWLMEQLGLDAKHYREQVLLMRPRLDAHLEKRGPWQQAMFAEYYDRFKLEKPPVLQSTVMQKGTIARRVPVGSYDDNTTYDLTHEVFVAFDYGLQRAQSRFSKEDLAYTREVLPELVRRYAREKNPDLVGELLSCMTYLGWHSDPAYQYAINFLLDGQNPNGTWGDYEKLRNRFGKYLEHHVYLHTTMVVMESLTEAFEGHWSKSG